MRESGELYQSGDEVMAGVYRDLKTGNLIRVYHDGDRLPEPE